ncbi:MAG: SDR family oxidoreductase [Dehalococcoidia bacterium]|mgnify:FL=1|nr:SDR family oxidoreductase [Dehalococcoidia bacterium]|tara:strand:+ start:14901 stop:15677 length:777 start_codon:yes stop_codon:yes gene_type:complete
MKLEGKVAAITGGTRGIGRGIADAFIAEGASVVINGRSEEKGQRALEEMGVGDRAIFVQGDVTETGVMDNLIEEAVKEYGKIDILVNNAGGAGDFAPVVELSDEGFDFAIKWNLYATFWGMRAALRQMIPQESGRIINISSVEGKHGKPGIAQYVSAKHAINGLTKSAAQEVGTMGITVNSICPGLIMTDIVNEQGAAAAEAMGLTFDEMVAQFSSESSIKRPNTVEEVAAMAVLLASDEASGITGALLSVDGGTAAY